MSIEETLPYYLAMTTIEKFTSWVAVDLIGVK